ncbi:MAG: amidohydrolase [Bacteroidetes bacterium]|nr:MAG: amidohydrolase [Bacteroidota bacterium]REK04699.1 MAG: amidohydrolase [Bacteroidota bacterium]REK36174.1 MAG: amidohydrolase [Bacteroidota bacterium]REK51455.1 MAG: amidohydrolase [Bacteroidota bacterium]
MNKVCLVLFASFIWMNASRAQETFPENGTSDPRNAVYALVNAKVFADASLSIDSAVLLISKGKILDVGKNISIPGHALMIDMGGRHIYPSFIDLFSEYGLPEIKKEHRHDAGPQFLSSVKGAYGWNQAVRPEYNAHKHFSVDEKKAEELRKLGFGAVMSINRDGIVRGTSVLVCLGNDREHEMIIRDRAAANYSFHKGTSTQDYPSSLMGSIALLRQTYYDALWYKNGGYRKEYNISLDEFNKIQNLPQMFEAGDRQNILRASRIAGEFGVKYIIKGAGDEYRRADELKDSGLELVIPLNFPEAFDLSDPYDALNVSLEQMLHWEHAPANASRIEKSGIRFAFTLSDLKNKSDFMKNLRKAIEAGLSEQMALAALTEVPASMIGAQNEIGRLQKGMIANFMVCSRSLFEKDNVILENWVKGVRYKIHDTDLPDIRGNYSLRIGNDSLIRLRVSGEIIAPEFHYFQDTSFRKIQSSISGKVLNLVIQRKEQKQEKSIRLTAVLGSSAKQGLSGDALLPEGKWVKWTAQFDSSLSMIAPKDTSAKSVSRISEISYPNMSYGWKEKPKQIDVLFRNATVWTNEKEGILENADVYISQGRIVQVGQNLKMPAGATVIDASGKHLTSGIIDEHSHIAVSGSVNESTQSSSAEVRIGDVIDSDDIQIYRQLAGGVTSTHILHGSANAIGGQTQLIKLRWGQSAEKLKFENAPGFIKFALGENVKQSHWGDKQVVRFPQTRMGVEQVYVDYFTKAREYIESQKLQDKKVKHASQDPLRKDLELDAIAEILQSKRFITCHSYVQSEINMLMHVADNFGFKVNTFTHILEGYKVADKMKKHGVLGASSFSDWWAYKFEVYESIPHNGAILHRMGVNVAFNSDDAEMARRLNQEAAKAITYGGISREEAWKFVTLNPAIMLRVDQRVGSIKAGKDADLVLWSDDPLSVYARAIQTYVDGALYYDESLDLQLRGNIEKERARLTALMLEAKTKGEQTQKPVQKKQILKHCMDDEH